MKLNPNDYINSIYSEIDSEYCYLYELEKEENTYLRFKCCIFKINKHLKIIKKSSFKEVIFQITFDLKPKSNYNNSIIYVGSATSSKEARNIIQNYHSSLIFK